MSRDTVRSAAAAAVLACVLVVSAGSATDRLLSSDLPATRTVTSHATARFDDVDVAAVDADGAPAQVGTRVEPAVPAAIEGDDPVEAPPADGGAPHARTAAAPGAARDRGDRGRPVPDVPADAARAPRHPATPDAAAPAAAVPRRPAAASSTDEAPRHPTPAPPDPAPSDTRRMLAAALDVWALDVPEPTGTGAAPERGVGEPSGREPERNADGADGGHVEELAVEDFEGGGLDQVGDDGAQVDDALGPTPGQAPATASPSPSPSVPEDRPTPLP